MVTTMMVCSIKAAFSIDIDPCIGLKPKVFYTILRRGFICEAYCAAICGIILEISEKPGSLRVINPSGECQLSP